MENWGVLRAVEIVGDMDDIIFVIELIEEIDSYQMQKKISL